MKRVGGPKIWFIFGNNFLVSTGAVFGAGSDFAGEGPAIIQFKKVGGSAPQRWMCFSIKGINFRIKTNK